MPCVRSPTRASPRSSAATACRSPGAPWPSTGRSCAFRLRTFASPCTEAFGRRRFPMKVEYTGRQTEVTDELRRLAERKLQKLAKVLRGITAVHVVLAED